MVDTQYNIPCIFCITRVQHCCELRGSSRAYLYFKATQNALQSTVVKENYSKPSKKWHICRHQKHFPLG